MAKLDSGVGKLTSLDQAKTRAFEKRGGDDHHAHGPSDVEVRDGRNGARGDRPMRFVSLHHHTTYSFLDGIGLPEAHVRRAAELNMPAIAVTEHGSVSSHVKLEVAAEKYGIQPIFGCELYTGPTDEQHRSRIKKHLTILAENPQGYGNLNRLVSRSFAEGFFQAPTVDMRMLEEEGDGLIVLSGCQGGELHCSLVGGKDIPPEQASYKRGRAVARRFLKTFGDRYYLEVQAFPELEETCRVNPLLAQLGRELGIPLVASLDVHYTVPDESELQTVLHSVRGGSKQTYEEQHRKWGYKAKLCPPLRDADVVRALCGTGLTRQEAWNAVGMTEEIAARCDGWKLPKLPMLEYTDPRGRTNWEAWEQDLNDGWYFRGLDLLPKRDQARYRKQLRYERSIIEPRGFQDYLLVIADIITWAKDNNIPVGPARGSAAGSLVCWLLRITEVDPLKYPHLIFERFIDVSRQDLPDIDVDFDSDQRWRVRQRLVERYGDECVNNVGTFSTYKPRLALDDVARVHRIPKGETAAIKSVLLERSSGDLRASATLEDTVEEFDVAKAVVDRHPQLRQAMDLEGNLRGFSVHAAGFVVSNGPVTDVCAVYERKVKDQVAQVVSLDMWDAARQGMLKIDLLGLNTMAMLAEGLRHLGMSVQDLYDLPLDDPEVIGGFQRNDAIGIFQYDGFAMRTIAGQIRPDDFNEVCVVTALARPGPLHNGATEAYVALKHGTITGDSKKDAKWWAGRERYSMLNQRLHPALDRITESTKYQIVYQEQILRIVREIGNFDWTSAGYIRKIISKKLGEAEFNRQWARFWEGAQRLHPDMTEETARAIWGSCITAGAYAFNCAHSVSYGMLAYWTMWLKVKHPVVFYAASLARMGDGKEYSLLRDALRHGIAVLPPSPMSARSWQPGRPLRRGDLQGPRRAVVRAGLEQLPGCAEKMTTKILGWRGRRSPAWPDLTQIPGIGPKKVERWREFCEQEDPFQIMVVDKQIAAARKLIADSHGQLPTPTYRSADVPFMYGEEARIVWIGLVHERNLRDIFETNRARTGEELDPSTVRDPHLREFMLMLGDDGEDLLRLRFDRWRYPQFRRILWQIRLSHDVVLVEAVKPHWRAAREVYVHKMWVIDPD